VLEYQTRDPALLSVLNEVVKKQSEHGSPPFQPGSCDGTISSLTTLQISVAASSEKSIGLSAQRGALDSRNQQYTTELTHKYNRAS